MAYGYRTKRGDWGTRCYCSTCSCKQMEKCNAVPHKCCRCGKSGTTPFTDINGNEVEIWAFPVSNRDVDRRNDGFDFIDLVNFMTGQVVAVYNINSPFNITYRWVTSRDNKGSTRHQEIRHYLIRAHYKMNDRKRTLCGQNIDKDWSLQQVNEKGGIAMPGGTRTISKNGSKYVVRFEPCGNCQYVFGSLNEQFKKVKEAIDTVRCTECGELACILCSYNEKKPFAGKMTCHHCHESFQTLKALAKLKG